MFIILVGSRGSNEEYWHSNHPKINIAIQINGKLLRNYQISFLGRGLVTNI